MKNILLLVLICLFPFTVQAETAVVKVKDFPSGPNSGDNYRIQYNFSKISAQADGSDEIIVKVTLLAGKDYNTNVILKSKDYSEGETLGAESYIVYFTLSGDSNSLEACSNKGCGVPDEYQGKKIFYLTNPQSDESNTIKEGYLRIKSKSAEAKTIKFYLDAIANGVGSFRDIEFYNTNLKFTVPTATTKITSKTSAPIVTKPSAPVVSKISNKDIAKNADGTFIPTVIRQGTPVTFSGTTSANATVHLTIHSDPITVDVKADADGNWTYTLDKEIALGEHTVDATVIDMAGQTSDSATIAQFILIEPVTPIAVEPVEIAKFAMTPITWGLSALALILLGGLGFYEFKRRKTQRFSRLSR